MIQEDNQYLKNMNLSKPGNILIGYPHPLIGLYISDNKNHTVFQSNIYEIILIYVL